LLAVEATELVTDAVNVFQTPDRPEASPMNECKALAIPGRQRL
jgi:hypothetical protein